MPLTATITSHVNGPDVSVHLVVSNESTSNVVHIEPRHLLQDEGSLGSILEIRSEGKSIPFLGRMAKARAVSPETMVAIPNGGHVTGDANITALFQFTPGRHVYQIQYEAFIPGAAPGEPLIDIKSAPVTFTLEH